VAAPRIQRRVPADAAQIPRLRAAVNSFATDHCDHSEATRQAIALTVTEACANVVCHAYPETHGELTLTAWVENEALFVTIVDSGVGLNGVSRNKGSGLGLRLIRELATSEIRSDEHGTRVRLEFSRA
jgi:two-component sensor histidine kinase